SSYDLPRDPVPPPHSGEPEDPAREPRPLPRGDSPEGGLTTFGAEPIVIESLRDGGPSGPEPDRVPSKTERSEHCLRTVSLFQRFSGRPESSEGDLPRFFWKRC